ncbi:Integrase core domain-containing protein, partial [Andreprevotia lacus DSM 23236]
IDNGEAQREFDRWRLTYNTVRPHEALGMATPITRYRTSEIAYPEVLPQPEYLASDKTYKVDKAALITFQGQRFKIGRAFIGQRIGLRPTLMDGVWTVWFSRFEIGTIDMRTTGAGMTRSVTHVPEHL